jgi:hypothetical protein
MRRFSFVVGLAAVVVAASSAEAQRGRINRNSNYDDCCYGNRFSLDPYAGAMKDAYAIGASDDLGYLVGFRVAYRLGSRTRLIGNLGYSNTENVSDPGTLASYYIYDNVWVMTTGGAEFDVVPGRTSASLGVQFGAGWRKLDLEGSVGTPLEAPQDDSNFSAYTMVMPTLTGRHRLNSRAALTLTLADHIFDAFDGPAQHSPALTLGVSFR